MKKGRLDNKNVSDMCSFHLKTDVKYIKTFLISKFYLKIRPIDRFNQTNEVQN